MVVLQHGLLMNHSPELPDADVPTGFRVVEISREPVELYKILKFEGVVDSGGQARAVVGAGQVSVNGAVELQKRKKIRSGDRIEFAGDRMLVKCDVSATDAGDAATPAVQRTPKKSKPGATQDGKLTTRPRRT